MKDVTCEGFGFTDDGDAVLAYTVEMRDGRDLSGTFEVRYAAVKRDDEAQFAIIDRRGNALAVYEWSAPVRELVTTLIDDRQHKAALSYENTGWADGLDTYNFVITPSDLGARCDYVQTISLDGQDVIALQQIRDALDDRCGVPDP